MISDKISRRDPNRNNCFYLKTLLLKEKKEEERDLYRIVRINLEII